MRRLTQQIQNGDLNRQLARIVRQCGRELLLLQASDWPFMVSTGSTVDHARQRAALHYKDFQWCRSLAEKFLAGEALTEEECHLLEEIEERDLLFRKLEPQGLWN